MTSDRLFVPLNTEHHENFANGSKDIELRGVNSNFNPKTVSAGRPVEIRRGYSYDPLWGVIGDRWHFRHLASIPAALDHERILPGSTREEFLKSAASLLDGSNGYIAFEVTFCPGCDGALEQRRVITDRGYEYELECPDCCRIVDAWGNLE